MILRWNGVFGTWPGTMACGLIIVTLLGGGLCGQSLLPPPPYASPSLPQIHARALAWADYDGDGRIDLLMAGTDSTGTARTFLLRNRPAGFLQVSHPFSPLKEAAAAWADTDGDGDPDLVLSGILAGRAHTEYWRNNGPAGFSLFQTDLPATREGRLSWADLDGDGDKDLIITGFNPDRGYVTLVMRNNGAGLLSEAASLEGMSHSDQVVAVLDSGALPGILVCGRKIDSEPATLRFANRGGLRFEAVPHEFPALSEGSLSAADIDGDGDADILGTGMLRPYALGIWRNDSGMLSAAPGPGLPGIVFGEARWADFNLDGNTGFFYCGEQIGGAAVARVMRALPAGGYSDYQPAYPIPAPRRASLAWADWSGDGYPDLVVSGLDDYARPVAFLLLNDRAGGRFEP